MCAGEGRGTLYHNGVATVVAQGMEITLEPPLTLSLVCAVVCVCGCVCVGDRFGIFYLAVDRRGSKGAAYFLMCNS